MKFNIVIYASGRSEQLIKFALEIPASFLSRIFFHSASAFLADQFSIFVEKLRKKRYSFAFDISTKSNFNFPNVDDAAEKLIHKLFFVPCASVTFFIEN